MDHESVGRYWDENAGVWADLVRAGYDHYRDGLNTPAFFAMLPAVDGFSGLDVGCGEGHNTRLLAERGARMTGIDISCAFVRHAREAEEAHPLGIRYEVASAVELPFEGASFDFVTAFMSLMDIPEIERVLAEVFQVLRPGGFLQFSISHPCFEAPHRRTLRDASGRAYAREVGDYFRRMNGEVEEWLFSAAPPEVRAGTRPFRVPRFTRTLSEWLNLLIDAGFVLERLGERVRAMMQSGSGPGYRARRSSPFSCEFGRASRLEATSIRSLLLRARVAPSGRSGLCSPRRPGRANRTDPSSPSPQP